MFKAQKTVDDKPATPPVLMLFGSRKMVQPMPYEMHPRVIIT